MKNKSNGFTLIELMIAISILTMLLFMGSYVYQMLASRWDKELGTFNHSAKWAKNLTLTKNLLQGVQPFIIMNKSAKVKKNAFFFVGSNDSLLSVSRSGLFDKNYSEIFRLKVLQKSNGLFDLVYQSASTKNTLLLYAQQKITFEQQVTLLKGVTEIKFNYLGWDGFIEKGEAEEDNSIPTWRESFSGIDNQLLPERMTVYIRKGQKIVEFSVIFDSNSLRYLSAYMEE
jgi:prepilin-type N-terminal cleavage/methylation domain-containing protein